MSCSQRPGPRARSDSNPQAAAVIDVGESSSGNEDCGPFGAGRRLGNCLSFSNMLAAMARYVGLEVLYQEVDIPPDWTFQNNLFLLNRHVNVSVDPGSLGQHVVDFNIDEFKSSYDMRKISD